MSEEQLEQKQIEREIMKRKLRAEIKILRAEVEKKKAEIDLLDCNEF